MKPSYIFNIQQLRQRPEVIRLTCMQKFRKAANIYTTFNSLWPSYATLWHKPESALPQVMACCLTASSHYLKPCWLDIWGQLCKRYINYKISLKLDNLKCHSNLWRANALTAQRLYLWNCVCLWLGSYFMCFAKCVAYVSLSNTCCYVVGILKLLFIACAI